MLPHLFSRLTDDAPHESSELPSAYTLTVAGLHDEIRRDLAHLLNASSLANLIDPALYPLAAESCLNFGISPVAGQPLLLSELDALARQINQAVSRFEPRLVPDSVTLRCLPDPAATAGRRRSGDGPPTLHTRQPIEIRALLRCQVYPVEFTVQSAVDFSTRRLTVFGPA